MLKLRKKKTSPELIMVWGFLILLEAKEREKNIQSLNVKVNYSLRIVTMG